MRYADFIEPMRAEGGFATADHAYRAAAAVLGALGEGLEPRLAQRLVAELPPPLGMAVGAFAARSLEKDALCARLAAQRGVTPGMAVEHLSMTLAALAAALSPGTCELLRAALPPDVARLLAPRPAPGPSPTQRRRDHTLATGRPGSTHPLSESAPLAGQRGSVARGDEPRGVARGATNRR